MECHHDIVTTLASREFNQPLNLAKKAAATGPIIITDRGKPAHVLLSFEDYQRLSGKGHKIAGLLAMPEALELDLTPARDLPRPADLS